MTTTAKRLHEHDASSASFPSVSSSADSVSSARLRLCSFWFVDLRSATLMYVVALALVGVLTAAVQVIVQVQLAQAGPLMKLVNKAGRQRFFCQMLSKETLIAVNAQWPYRNETAGLERNMTDNLASWVQGMQMLQSDLNEWFPSALPLAREAAAMQVTMVDNFRAIQSLLESNNGSIYDFSVTLPRISKAFDLEWHFLDKISSITMNLTDKSEEAFQQLKIVEFVSIICIVALLFVEACFLFRPGVNKIRKLFRRLRREHIVACGANEELMAERQKTQMLLENVLPHSIAERLQAEPDLPVSEIAKVHDASVLFADIVGFTMLAGSLPPSEVVDLLHLIFTEFDELCRQRPGCEKIKTIGDAYMVAAGLGDQAINHAALLADLGLAMLRHMELLPLKGIPGGLQIRIGISSGSLVAGIIGTLRFSYDVWGDTVNTASRMESTGKPGRIQVSSATNQLLLGGDFVMKRRGRIVVKGKGDMTTYWLLGRESEHRTELLRQVSDAAESTTQSTTTPSVPSSPTRLRPSFRFLQSPRQSLSVDPLLSTAVATRGSRSPARRMSDDSPRPKSAESRRQSKSATPDSATGFAPVQSVSLPPDVHLHSPSVSVRSSANLHSAAPVPNLAYSALAAGLGGLAGGADADAEDAGVLEVYDDDANEAADSTSERTPLTAPLPATRPEQTLPLSTTFSSAMSRSFDSGWPVGASASTTMAPQGSTVEPRRRSVSLRMTSSVWRRPGESSSSDDDEDNAGGGAIGLGDVRFVRGGDRTRDFERDRAGARGDSEHDADADAERDSVEMSSAVRRWPTLLAAASSGWSKTPLGSARSTSFGAASYRSSESGSSGTTVGYLPRPTLSMLLGGMPTARTTQLAFAGYTGAGSGAGNNAATGNNSDLTGSPKSATGVRTERTERNSTSS